MDNGKEVSFNPREMRHFDQGYAVTSHTFQGRTAELVCWKTWTLMVHSQLINPRFAYVSVSRASHDAQIFTNNGAILAEVFARDVPKTPAIDFKGPSPIAVAGLEQAVVIKNHRLPALNCFFETVGKVWLA